MSKYYSKDRDSYFEEPKTTFKPDSAATAKQAVDDFKNEIVDPRYSVKRPIARILGHVKKQD